MAFPQFMVLKQKRQMYKVITILILLLTALPSFCQKRNAKGQKVVSKIEIISGKGTTPYVFIDFTYDSSLCLNEITYYAPISKEKEYWKREGNTITKKDVWFYKSI